MKKLASKSRQKSLENRPSVSSGSPRTDPDSIARKSQLNASRSFWNWVDGQGPVNWVKVTLSIEGRSRHEPNRFQKALRQALWHIDYEVLGGNAVIRRRDHPLRVPKYLLYVSDNRFVLKELKPNGTERIRFNHGKTRSDRFSVIYDSILKEKVEIVPVHNQ
jgi:hypothetical protein